MSSEPVVGYKRSAPDNSDDDGSQPERGKEAEAAGPKLDQDERQKNKKLRRDGEARNLSREERKMTAIMRQIPRGDGAKGEGCQGWSLLNSARGQGRECKRESG